MSLKTDALHSLHQQVAPQCLVEKRYQEFFFSACYVNLCWEKQQLLSSGWLQPCGETETKLLMSLQHLDKTVRCCVKVNVFVMVQKLFTITSQYPSTKCAEDKVNQWISVLQMCCSNKPTDIKPVLLFSHTSQTNKLTASPQGWSPPELKSCCSTTHHIFIVFPHQEQTWKFLKSDADRRHLLVK